MHTWFGQIFPHPSPEDRPSWWSSQCVRCVCFPQLCSGGHCWTLETGSSLFRISYLTAFFSFQTESIQVTLPLEDHLEGKVGFKTYKNYFTAGAGWSVILFLILVNIAAQVNKDIYFGVCPQFGIYILFVLYLWLFLVCIWRYLS